MKSHKEHRLRMTNNVPLWTRESVNHDGMRLK